MITLRISRYLARTLGEYIRKWILEQGLFQVDLAKRIGVSEMTIVNREEGKTKPVEKNIERIKRVLENFINAIVFFNLIILNYKLFNKIIYLLI